MSNLYRLCQYYNPLLLPARKIRDKMSVNAEDNEGFAKTAACL
jgi:hypothetical protein